MTARIRKCVAVLGLLAITGTMGGCVCVDWCGAFWSVGIGGCGRGFGHCR